MIYKKNVDDMLAELLQVDREGDIRQKIRIEMIPSMAEKPVMELEQIKMFFEIFSKSLIQDAYTRASIRAIFDIICEEVDALIAKKFAAIEAETRE